MSESQTPGLRRIDELLLDRVAGGLTAHELEELDALLETEASDLEAGWEEAAALLSVAKLPAAEPMPQSLRDKIMLDAGGHLAATRQASTADSIPDLKLTGAPRPVHPVLAFIGGAAAAAVLTIASFVSTMDPNLRRRRSRWRRSARCPAR